jgi:hypothetical protein
LIGLIVRGRLLLRRPLVWLCLLWFGLSLFLVARAASWWGGWSFGPRILTDIWPGLVLLTAITWQAMERPLTGDGRPKAVPQSPISSLQSPAPLRYFAIAYTGLGFLAILLHVGMGLNSQVASRWNGSIRPLPLRDDPTLGDLFNWEYAQPLANNRMLCSLGARWFAQTMSDYGLPLVTYSPGQVIGFDADQITPWPAVAVPNTSDANLEGATAGQSMLPIIARPGNAAAFQGWGNPYEDSRWSQCYDSQIYLLMGDLPADESSARLSVTAAANGPQAIEVQINGRPIGTLLRSTAQQTTTLVFPASILEPDTLNVINFHFPDAHYPNLHDQRPLGINFTSLVIIVGNHSTVGSQRKLTTIH